MEFFQENIHLPEVLVQLLAFLIVFFTLKKFAWKPLLAIIKSRRERFENEWSGIEKSKKFADLLKTHVRITFDVVEAAKVGDKTGLEAANQKWHDNASDIAAFLNELNPKYWPKQCLDDTWDQHLSLTMDQITGRLQKNWKDDITAFDKDFAHILEFAECFAEGIIKQFSSRFYRY